MAALLLGALAAGYLLALVLSGAGAWVRWGTFVVLALGVARLLWRYLHAAPRPPARTPRVEPDVPVELPPRPRATEMELLAHACELVRRATDAEEAAIWQADPAVTHVVRLARAGYLEDEFAGGERVPLDAPPFRWPILEGEYTRLARGKKPLPLSWAAEMLLVPVPSEPRGVLVLGYPGIVPPGADAAAHTAGEHLAELLELIALRRRAEDESVRLRSMLDAVGAVAGATEMAPLAARLAEAVLGATGGTGAAVVSWDGERGRGELLALAGEAGALAVGAAFGEGESRAALAAKHATSFLLPDLGGERERLPLLLHGERWSEPVRSALLVPLVLQDRGVGALVTWHTSANAFADSETELLALLGRVASPSMQGARAYDALNERASTDALTGLANRRALEARLSAVASHFDRYGRPFALLILDVDHFKRFNDTWGHEAGDLVLQHVAELLRATVREVDLPARLGGEEFVVLLPETPLAEALEAAERVRRRIESNAVLWNGRPLSVTASFGVAACPDSGVPPAELLAAADSALYASKESGRNRVSASTVGAQAR
jgi:diguanylate cyclase (GGDEF)-like protein